MAHTSSKSAARKAAPAAAVKSVVQHAIALGTPVLTLDGEMPVEFLSPGDRIITRTGVCRLVAVEVRVVQNARVIRIGQGMLGHERPEIDMIVSPDQPILIRDWRAQAMYGAALAMIPAARLADGEYIRDEVLDEVRLYSLHLADDAVIYANGLELACAKSTIIA